MWNKGGNGHAPFPPLIFLAIARRRLLFEAAYTSKRPAVRTFFHDGLFK